PVETSTNIAMALTSTIPGLDVDAPSDDLDGPVQSMNLANTLPGPGQAISLHINAQAGMSTPGPLGLRQLHAGVGIFDYDRYNCEFVDVVGKILRSQVVLTDNRRIPFQRRFTHASFDRPLDLRDGSNVPIELFRLKNGNAAEQRRYTAIEGTFADLTGRT